MPQTKSAEYHKIFQKIYKNNRKEGNNDEKQKISSFLQHKYDYSRFEYEKIQKSFQCSYNVGLLIKNIKEENNPTAEAQIV